MQTQERYWLESDEQDGTWARWGWYASQSEAEEAMSRHAANYPHLAWRITKVIV